MRSTTGAMGQEMPLCPWACNYLMREIISSKTKLRAENLRRSRRSSLLSCIFEMCMRHVGRNMICAYAWLDCRSILSTPRSRASVYSLDVRLRSGDIVPDNRSRQMRYRPSVASDFSVLVVLHRERRIETVRFGARQLLKTFGGHRGETR